MTIPACSPDIGSPCMSVREVAVRPRPPCDSFLSSSWIGLAFLVDQRISFVDLVDYLVFIIVGRQNCNWKNLIYRLALQHDMSKTEYALIVRNSRGILSYLFTHSTCLHCKTSGQKDSAECVKCELCFFSLINRSDRKPRVNSAYTVFSFISPNLNSESGLGYALKTLPSSLLHLCVQR